MRAARNATRKWSGTAIVLTTLLVTFLVLGAVVFFCLKQGRIRRWTAQQLWEAPATMSASPFDLRVILLDNRDRALDAGDLPAAARYNAKLAQEALRRARAVHDAWLVRREPKTKLYAERYYGGEWNYRNTAADFFGFHVHAALRLNPQAMPSLQETLAAELLLRTTDGLCQPVMAATGKPVSVDQDELLFASSEYCKDGLLSIYERYGGDLVGPRMLAIVDAIMARSTQPSRYGALPGTGAEINGNMLQLGGRLTLATGDQRYAQFSAQVADAIIRQALPANGGIPPKFFDYESDRVIDPTLKLKDHGNEVLPGLAEMYAFAVSRMSDPVWASRAEAWADPLAKMFEIVLEHGVNKDGLFVETMSPNPPRPTSTSLCDNWGYILLGATLFVETAQRHGLLPSDRLRQLDQRIDQRVETVLARTPPKLFDGGIDSEADALEGMMYMGFFRPHFRQRALNWVDRQIALMYSHQRPDGLAGIHYLDGNFIRTSLLYADARSGGWRVEPWREDVLVGFAQDDRQPGRAVLVVQCTKPYSGTLRPDSPRHRDILHLPWDWPRLNCWPEWFLLDPGVSVLDVQGLPGKPSIDELKAGLPLDLPANGSVTITFGGE